MLRPYTRRLLLLLPTTTYRTAAFVEAARRLGVELTVASERPSTFEGAQPAAFLTLDFAAPERAAEQAAEFARRHPVAGAVVVDDALAGGGLHSRSGSRTRGPRGGRPAPCARAVRQAGPARWPVLRGIDLHDAVTPAAAGAGCAGRVRARRGRGARHSGRAGPCRAPMERERAVADRARGALDRRALQRGAPLRGRGDVAGRDHHSPRARDAAPVTRARAPGVGGYDDPGPHDGGAARTAERRSRPGGTPRCTARNARCPRGSRASSRCGRTRRSAGRTQPARTGRRTGRR